MVRTFIIALDFKSKIMKYLTYLSEVYYKKALHLLVE